MNEKKEYVFEKTYRLLDIYMEQMERLSEIAAKETKNLIEGENSQMNFETMERINKNIQAMGFRTEQIGYWLTTAKKRICDLPPKD